MKNRNKDHIPSYKYLHDVQFDIFIINLVSSTDANHKPVEVEYVLLRNFLYSQSLLILQYLILYLPQSFQDTFLYFHFSIPRIAHRKITNMCFINRDTRRRNYLWSDICQISFNFSQLTTRLLFPLAFELDAYGSATSLLVFQEHL